MTQNIFDNETFFREYTDLRSRDDNYNDLLEQPSMRALLPSLVGKRVLDIGCGFGHNCAQFAAMGAGRVVGIDLSEKMLSKAKEENADTVISYYQMDMAEISRLEGPFDFVYSSLAFHYAADFTKLTNDIFSLLTNGGELLFSQEHPFVTSSKNDGGHYLTDENGDAVSYCFSDYADSGKRIGKWFVDDVEKYHRTFSDIINALCGAGFHIEQICEPTPTEEAVRIRPGLRKEFIKPTFLIVKAKKM